MSSASISSARPPGKAWQFSLQQLIVAMVCIAVWLALVTQLLWDGVVIGWVLSCCAAIASGAIRRRLLVVEAGVVALILTGCVAALLPTCPAAGPPSHRSQCRNNLRSIALALQNYHDTYNTFPPAYIADAQGRPMHSWRVLILPFLEQEQLYRQYRFDEPWNGPNNSKLAAGVERFGHHCLSCPAEKDTKPQSETSYLAVIGPGTVWPGATPTNMAQIADGTSDTLLVVEVHDSGVHWMEPRDLHLHQIPLRINPPRGPGLRSSHKGGAQAAFVDAHVETLPNELSPDILWGLFTIAGGEAVGNR
ncbi:MAG: DUF1559 domain-containing protein [Pirellulaceae bacterium]|nr:DUF1559 domain-containing protein [Pirellulaceae bacterium]